MQKKHCKNLLYLDLLTYNLVISDIRMPDMNGLELYNSLKAINRNVRIIFVTALDIAQELVSILPGLKEKML
jgi:two-component system, OmpR family, response regulator ChvI